MTQLSRYIDETYNNLKKLGFNKLDNTGYHININKDTVNLITYKNREKAKNSITYDLHHRCLRTDDLIRALHDARDDYTVIYEIRHSINLKTEIRIGDKRPILQQFWFKNSDDILKYERLLGIKVQDLPLPTLTLI
jgi:hypothetical protein